MLFIDKMLKKCTEFDILFSIPEEKQLNRNWKAQIFLRTYDTNQKVAALAVTAIGHYQHEVSI